MAALEDFDEYLTERHEALEAGSEFSLVELMGKRWAEIEALGQDAHSMEDGHLFHAIVGTNSTASWAAIPREGGQLV